MHYQSKKLPLQKSSSTSIKFPKIDHHLNILKQPTKSKQSNNSLYQLQNQHEIYSNKKYSFRKSLSIRKKQQKSAKSHQLSKNKLQYIKSHKQSTTLEKYKQNHHSSNNPQNHSTPSNSNHNLDTTLTNFKKYILQNKQHIHQQLNKKIYLNKINRNSDHNITLYQLKQKKNPNNLSLDKNISPKNNQISIFNNIQQIINKSNITLGAINLNQIEKQSKINDIKKTMKKYSPDKSINQIKQDLIKQIKYHDPQNKFILKDQNNYYQWRRVNMKSTQLSSYYSQSTLDIQNQRLTNLTHQTQASLSNYLQTKKHLLQLQSSSPPSNQ